MNKKLIFTLIIFLIFVTIANINTSKAKTLLPDESVTANAVNLVNQENSAQKITKQHICAYNISNINWRWAQGFCTDSSNYYVAIVNMKSGDEMQWAQILKIQISTGALVAKSEPKQIGHANSLTYVKDENAIIIISENGLIHKMNASTMKYFTNGTSDSWQLTTTQIDENENKITKDVKFANIFYNELTDEYMCVRRDAEAERDYVSIFNREFLYLRSFPLTESIGVDGYDNTNYQTLYGDGEYLYYLCNNLNVTPHRNYILIYDYYGNFKEKIIFTKSLGDERFLSEAEGISITNGKFYMLTAIKDSSIEDNNI